MRVAAEARLVFANSTSRQTRFILEPGASAEFRGGDVELGRGGIATRNATLVLQDMTFESSTEEFLRVQGGTAIVVETVFRGSGGGRPGVVLEQGSLVVSHSRLEGSSGYGFQATGGTLVVEDSVIAGSADYGLQAIGSTVRLSGNRWETHCGVLLVAGAQANVRGDTFQSSQRGFTVTDGSNATIGESVFDSLEAVQFVGGGGSLSNSTIRAAATGTRLVDSTARLVGNQYALAGIEAHESPQAQARANSFTGPGVALRNTGAAFDAAGNWWGQADGPRQEQIEGDAVVDEWLRQSPAQQN
ncbi:MAG: right-handed parallel beta-helix repeat-containing protein [Candidatus Thermoplasmatota archaeon]